MRPGRGQAAGPSSCPCRGPARARVRAHARGRGRRRCARARAPCRGPTRCPAPMWRAKRLGHACSRAPRLGAGRRSSRRPMPRWTRRWRQGESGARRRREEGRCGECRPQGENCAHEDLIEPKFAVESQKGRDDARDGGRRRLDVSLRRSSGRCARTARERAPRGRLRRRRCRGCPSRGRLARRRRADGRSRLGGCACSAGECGL